MFHSFIPKHIPNRVVLWVWKFVGRLFRLSERMIERNRLENESILLGKAISDSAQQLIVSDACIANSYIANTYIENQSQWDKVAFGSKYKMSYGGCEIIAVHNALLSLGQQMTPEDIVNLISYFERKGAALKGKIGVVPQAAYEYFEQQEYSVKMWCCTDADTINDIGRKYDSFIVTAYNDSGDIRKGLHTINISKDTTGKFILHNAYRVKLDKAGKKEYTCSVPYDTLSESISNISHKKAKSVCIISINRL